MYTNDGFSPYGSYPYMNRPYQMTPVAPMQGRCYYDYSSGHSLYERQQTVRGQATWTEGGKITKCGIPWSDGKYMTVAVGDDAPYKCGEMLRVRNLSLPGGREIVVKVVDEVEGYPANKINLHRRAFEALGANLDLGVIPVEITPTGNSNLDQWRDLLLTTLQTTYPHYRITDYCPIGKEQTSPAEVEEVYEFTLQSQGDRMMVRGIASYHPKTEQVHALELRVV
ncbi:MAG TPA: DUF3889 domain-containing protein [Bacillota bacterium]